MAQAGCVGSCQATSLSVRYISAAQPPRQLQKHRPSAPLNGAKKDKTLCGTKKGNNDDSNEAEDDDDAADDDAAAAAAKEEEEEEAHEDAQKKMAAVTASDTRACAAHGLWKDPAGLLGKKGLRPVAATTKLLFRARAKRSST